MFLEPSDGAGLAQGHNGYQNKKLKGTFRRDTMKERLNGREHHGSK